MKRFYTLVCSMVLVQLSLTAEMPEPYTSIHELPFDEQGWFINERQMERCLNKIKPNVVIEVGSWLGMSTRFIASRLPSDGKLYAVDTWKGSFNEEWHLKDPRISHLYQLFLSNVKHAGLADVIVPIRMNSLEAAAALDVQADFIYIDAAHDADSVYQDIMAWYPHLKKGGLMCGDDWDWGTVRLGVMRAARRLGLSVESNKNFWMFH